MWKPLLALHQHSPCPVAPLFQTACPCTSGQEARAALCGNKGPSISRGKKPQLHKQLIGHRKKEIVTLTLHGWLLQKWHGTHQYNSSEDKCHVSYRDTQVRIPKTHWRESKTRNSIALLRLHITPGISRQYRFSAVRDFAQQISRQRC